MRFSSFDLGFVVLLSFAPLHCAGFDARPSKGDNYTSLPKTPVNFYKGQTLIRTLSPDEIVQSLVNTELYPGVGAYWADLLPKEASGVFKLIFVNSGNIYALWRDRLYVHNLKAATGTYSDYHCDLCDEEPFET